MLNKIIGGLKAALGFAQFTLEQEVAELRAASARISCYSPSIAAAPESP